MVNWLWSNRKYNVYLQTYRSLQRIRLMTLLSNQLLLLLDKTVSMYAYMSKNSNNTLWSIGINIFWEPQTMLLFVSSRFYTLPPLWYTCTSTPQASFVLGDVTTIGLWLECKVTRSAQVHQSLDYAHEFAQLAVRCGVSQLFGLFVGFFSVFFVSVFLYALSSL